MIFYIVIILSCMAVLATINHFIALSLKVNLALWYNILGVTISAIAVIALDGLIAGITHKFQDKMNPFAKYFRVSPRQKRIMERLGVRRYKTLIPDLGFLVKFRKSKIVDPKSKEYIYAYMLETCSGEICHLLSMFLGFLIIFLFPLRQCLFFGVPVAVVNLVLNLLPFLALRYNRFRLIPLYKRLSEREEKPPENLLTEI